MRRFSYVAGHPEDGPPPADDEFEYRIEALDPEQAAEEAADHANRRDAECPKERAIWLKDVETGQMSAWTVYREMTPVYRAVEVHGDA